MHLAHMDCHRRHCRRLIEMGGDSEWWCGRGVVAQHPTGSPMLAWLLAPIERRERIYIYIYERWMRGSID